MATAKKKATASKPKTPGRKKTTAKKTAKPLPVEKTSAASIAEHPEGVLARLNSLREEMDNFFASMTRSFGFPDIKVPTIDWPSRPTFVDVRFDVSESDTALEVRAEVPGLSEEDLEIALTDGMLTIKGEKSDDREQKEKDIYIRECRYGSFFRSFRVPDSVIEDDIAADLEKGVLIIRLPKRAVAKRGPRSIRVSKKS